MGLDRVDREVELRGDLAVRCALGEQRQHFPLPFGQHGGRSVVGRLVDPDGLAPIDALEGLHQPDASLGLEDHAVHPHGRGIIEKGRRGIPGVQHDLVDDVVCKHVAYATERVPPSGERVEQRDVA